MYKLDIKTLTEIKNSLIETNDLLRKKTIVFSDMGSYVPSDVERQIQKNKEVIHILETVYFI